jgi:hypothetical protein
VDAPDEVPGDTGQGLGRGLEGLGLHLDHVADVVDQKADGAIVGANHHVHGGAVGRSLAQLEAAAQVDGGDDLTGAEDARQHLALAGFLLQHQALAVEAVQVLLTLDQELLDDLVLVLQITHEVAKGRSTPHRRLSISAADIVVRAEKPLRC